MFYVPCILLSKVYKQISEQTIIAQNGGENRGSNMSAHVLLNLLNELRKRDKM